MTRDLHSQENEGATISSEDRQHRRSPSTPPTDLTLFHPTRGVHEGRQALDSNACENLRRLQGRTHVSEFYAASLPTYRKNQPLPNSNPIPNVCPTTIPNLLSCTVLKLAPTARNRVMYCTCRGEDSRFSSALLPAYCSQRIAWV